MTENGKTEIVETILQYLCQHQDVPVELLRDIQEKYVSDSSSPLPPDLHILPLDKIFTPDDLDDDGDMITEDYDIMSYWSSWKVGK